MYPIYRFRDTEQKNVADSFLQPHQFKRIYFGGFQSWRSSL